MINSFNVGLKVGGDNRPLKIQPGESMTSKDYIKLALMFQNAIAANNEEKEISGDKNFSNHTDNILCDMINEVIEICENDNPRFNEDRFRTAIGES